MFCCHIAPCILVMWIYQYNLAVDSYVDVDTTATLQSQTFHERHWKGSRFPLLNFVLYLAVCSEGHGIDS